MLKKTKPEKIVKLKPHAKGKAWERGYHIGTLDIKVESVHTTINIETEYFYTTLLKVVAKCSTIHTFKTNMFSCMSIVSILHYTHHHTLF